MSINHRPVLGSIRRFDQLVAYLRDEMNWPIARDSFDDVDDLFFEFTPDELGLDNHNAAKIQEIKRLRPLCVTQPWGIFFVKFEPKRLPVVALRRILSRVSLKKRASSNSDDRAAWAPDDLLFVSNYGEGESRQISFAHFAQNEYKKDLPTLKVLGWDNLDTHLHLDHVAEILTERLTWPNDESDEESWKNKWRSAFTLEHRQVVNTSKALSVELAKLARSIRVRINTILDIETKNGPLTKLMDAFEKSLVHDLDNDGFADMYAQTIAYGLLSARVSNPSGNTADDIAKAMPITNPFLKELMETFLNVGGRRIKSGNIGNLDFDELGISEVVVLLDNANMEAVIRDFGDRNPNEDPVIHFYEDFLKEYDAKKRMQRGVYFTPRPVVSFIVRSVHELLRNEFGLEDGLADTTSWDEIVERNNKLRIPNGISGDQAFVQILDPATGTGTFLVEVIDLIHKTMINKWNDQGLSNNNINKHWNQYVIDFLLPRIHGYELMMAPYTIAHMKVGLKLYETGYQFESKNRTQIYLTNALEPASDIGQMNLKEFLPALAYEAQAVNDIKKNKRFTVIIGNPPYANFGQHNRISFILNLLSDYKEGLNEKKINLDDDFIKFIRLSQHAISTTGTGIHGMITNNVYIDGITHRRMRESLINQFPFIRMIDLHGNVSAQEKALDGTPDQNVFDIRQGVAISLMVIPPLPNRNIGFSELIGTQEFKYQSLLDNTISQFPITTLVTEPPYFFLSSKTFSGCDEYSKFFPLTAVFKNRSYGIQTKRDNITIGFDRKQITCHGDDLLKLDNASIRIKYNLPKDGRDWRVEWAREDIARLDSIENYVHKIFYRPFDIRWTIYTDKSKGFLAYPRWATMKCMLNKNIALIAMRQVFQDIEFYNHFCVTRLLIDERTFYSNRGGTYLFPLYNYLLDEEKIFRPNENHSVNLTDQFVQALYDCLNVDENPKGMQYKDVNSESIFSYIYSTLWSSGYRDRYKESLRIDYPRIPLPGTLGLFRELSKFGEQLIAYHLLESPSIDNYITSTVGYGGFQVEKVSYSEETVWIDKDKTTGFQGVPKKVWNFYIGGYQICHKWLKDRQAKGGKDPRPGRVLLATDIKHYQRIIVAISETIRITEDIDKTIENYGGWPDAFK